jgi:hypothetical protein
MIQALTRSGLAAAGLWRVPIKLSGGVADGQSSAAGRKPLPPFFDST